MTTQHAPAGHWGVNNPIPNIQRFVESLDKDKRERDRRIDEEERQKRQAEREGGAVPHAQQDSSKHKGTRKVTDPTTGKEVEIEDVGRDLVKESKDPDVRTFTLEEREEATSDPLRCFNSFRFPMPT